MAITLSQLCANTNETYGMKLLAGKLGLDNYVRWVHMIEDREVPDFLHGSELVFTTGIGQYGSTWLMNFVKSLKEHNAAGLIVNIGPYITSVPSKVIVYCEENDFPIFTVPWSVHLIDVTYDFCHRIVNSEENELSLGAAFKNLIFNPEEKGGYVHVLERRNFQNDSEYSILMFEFCDKNGKKLTSEWQNMKLMIRRALGKPNFPLCVLFHNGNLVIILQKVNTEVAEKIAEEICNTIKNIYPENQVYSGISDKITGYMGVPLSYRQAKSALEIATVESKVVKLYKDIGVYKILLGVEDYNILRDFMMSVLSPLMAYDEKNKSNLSYVLESYLKHNSSIIEVSQKLGVHRNTVNYKMKLVREILNIELTDSEKKIFFWLWISRSY